MEVRERFAIPAERVGDFYIQLNRLPDVAESVVINTCNRVEIYTVTNKGDSTKEVVDLLVEHNGLDPQLVDKHTRHLQGLSAVEHLFHVAAGIDSQMVGETEILGQIKDAYADALARQATGNVLNRTFQKSFQAAAWAHTHTGIGHGQVSVGNIAVELAMRIFGDLADSRVLVLGTGEVGRKTAQAFASRGARNLTVASRTFENARALAKEIGGGAVEMSAALATLGRHDIIIGSSAVTVPLVNESELRTAAEERQGDPLFLIDLGLPRNFPPANTGLRGVYLYNLDDLSAIANENLRSRLAEVEKAKTAMSSRAARLWEKICNSLSSASKENRV
jgi:glutamyl-tRNA reductase